MDRARDDGWRIGDHLVIDDRTGLKVWASETRKEWNGAIVHDEVFEPRHPQDFIRSRRDNMAVRDARPRPPDLFIGPLDTEMASDAAAGATALHLQSAARMQAGDRIVLMLDNGDTFRSVIDSVTDATHVVLVNPLPLASSTGKKFYDNTAMAQAEIG